MPVTKPRKRSASLTRQRILKAALARFTEVSYEEVGLRDIARDVGVDVALVHRSFGSKDQLFAEAFRAAAQSERLLSSTKIELGAALARNIFERGDDATPGNADALQIFVHSLSSPRAKEALRSFIVKDFITPLATRLDDRALERGALITACLVGISILRNVLQVKPLRDESRASSEPLIAEIFNRQMATMTKAGVPLVQAFEIVSEGEANPTMRDLIQKIHGDVSAGLRDESRASSEPLIAEIFNLCLDERSETNLSAVGPALTQRGSCDPPAASGTLARRRARSGAHAVIVHSSRTDDDDERDIQP